VLILGCALPVRADAAFPGANGDIAYGAPATGGADIFRIAPFGGTPVDVSMDPGNEFFPSWSPDGLRIAAAHEDSSVSQRDIVIYDAANPGTPTPVTNDAPNDVAATWSPDGSMLAFERVVVQMPPQDRDIYVVPAGGGAITPLITGPGSQGSPAWSPDGTRIAYSDNSGGSTDVKVIAASGTGPTVTIAESNPPEPETLPDWSPDSSRIVLSRDSGIVFANADGSGAVQPVPISEFFPVDPVWSPDGTRIGFTFGSVPRDVATVGLDGSGEAPTAATPGLDESGADWQRVEPQPAAAADTTPPETTIVTGPRKRTRKTRARFQFVSSEPGSTFQCTRDGRPIQACVSGLVLKVKKGKHRFEVRAVDQAGNADPTPAADRWKVKRKKRRHRR
jgi:dipeptidyl aminopeptidase/acylaminoacyl peptidase